MCSCSKMIRSIANWMASVAQTVIAIILMVYLFKDLYKVDTPEPTYADIAKALGYNTTDYTTGVPPLSSEQQAQLSESGYNSTKNTCYISRDGTDEQPCQFMLSVIVITWVSCLALSIIQCFTCNCCGLGSIFDAILSGCLCALWAYFSIRLTTDDRHIDNLDPSPVWNTPDITDTRNIVLYLSWAEVVLFAFTTYVGATGIFPSSEDRHK